MKKHSKQRMVGVVVHFKHGGSDYLALAPEVIALLPGQTFHKGPYGNNDTVKEGGTIIRQYDWRAGYTRVYEYTYSSLNPTALEVIARLTEKVKEANTPPPVPPSFTVSSPIYARPVPGGLHQFLEGYYEPTRTETRTQ